ncbi:MAG: hypothetical protein V2I43_12920 [Parvularcula sp.]|jgi:hypothetical protein|nr:hypothetical protein [Parvularcula sp.]
MKWLFSFLAVWTITMHTVGHAQLAPGYSGYSSAPVEGSEADYWFLVRQVGDCLVRQKPERAAALLRAEIDSGREASAFSNLFGRSYNSCMQNFVSASFLRSHIRGSIAEAFVRDRVRSTFNQSVLNFTSPETIASLHDFARCYIIRHSETAFALLEETKLSTEGELQFVTEMSEEFGSCLPRDRQVTLQANDVRMALAEALYHALPRSDGTRKD